MRTTNRRLLVALLLPLFAASLYAGTTTLGEPLSADLESVAIESIVDDPDGWAGKTVRVEGEIDAVCTMRGCWMDLVSAAGQVLRVKVDDGVIVFPAEAIGHQATAEGTIEILDMTRERYEAWMRHVADEEGRAFDPESLGEGPYRIVQLRGLGAEIAPL